jgi:UTP-glucose-1-phosphate uridylyltransferase/mevalonate kinase
MIHKIKLFVPGRLCLFGEHSDWAGRYNGQNADVLSGKAIVTGIDLGIYARAEICEDFHVRSFNAFGEKVEFRCPMHTANLRTAALEEEFFGYCCGVAAYLRENYHVNGIYIDITKVTLPVKKGLSSSAAITVLVAKAFNELYELALSTRGIMKVAYSGERLTKSRCGRLDQACAYGTVPVLMEFSDEDITVDKLKVGKNLYWVFADLCAKKNTKKILADLSKAYPFAQTKQDEALQYALGEANHKIISEAVEALERGEDKRLGELMTAAQKLFDENVAPACPDELNAPVLHSVLNDANIKNWIYGGKGVGSQGDGTVQFLAKDKESQRKLVDYLNHKRNMEAYSFELKAGGNVRRAVIPVAGFGTRMYPITHFIKKSFLPVIDENRIVKPVLLCILEELDKEGIEEIILVVGEEEADEFKAVFEYETDAGFRKKLPLYVREYYDTILRIGGKIRYAVQHERRGFGHAVYQARPYLHDEPVLLLLGDFVYHSDTGESCTKQTIDAYNKSGGKSVVSIKEVPLEDVVHYGIITGDFEEEKTNIIQVTEMVEKPEREYARDYLGCRLGANKKEEKYYATFGQYILTPAVFEYLEKQIIQYEENNCEDEIDLTGALCSLIQEGNLTAVKVQGKSYDVGNPESYLETLFDFSRAY